MQELKAFDVGLGQYSESGSPCIVAFDADGNPRLLDEKVYLKDEVDAVLAEKDAEIRRLKAQAEDDCAYWKTMAQKNAANNAVMAKQRAEALKRESRQKYKRCLANAWWCRNLSKTYAWGAYNHRGWKIDRYYDEKAELYRKWRKRWLELAEKFKEAK